MPLPKSFTDLVNNLTILPGVGEKTAERFVYSLYEKDMDEVENLAESLIEFKKTIKNCTNLLSRIHFTLRDKLFR